MSKEREPHLGLPKCIICTTSYKSSQSSLIDQLKSFEFEIYELNRDLGETSIFFENMIILH